MAAKLATVDERVLAYAEGSDDIRDAGVRITLQPCTAEAVLLLLI
jgi:hypothetical protein